MTTNYRSAVQWLVFAGASVFLLVALTLGSTPETGTASSSEWWLDKTRVIRARDDLRKIRGDAGADPTALAAAIFRVGNVASANGELDTAVAAFEELISDFPELPGFLGRAHFNLAVAYELHGDLSHAEDSYLKVLDLEVDERAESGDPRLMGNPYALFKHRASRSLADLYYRQERYKDAQTLHDLSIDPYSFQHFCGNAHAASAWRAAVSRIYLGHVMRELGTMDGREERKRGGLLYRLCHVYEVEELGHYQPFPTLAMPGAGATPDPACSTV